MPPRVGGPTAWSSPIAPGAAATSSTTAAVRRRQPCDTVAAPLAGQRRRALRRGREPSHRPRREHPADPAGAARHAVPRVAGAAPVCAGRARRGVVRGGSRARATARHQDACPHARGRSGGRDGARRRAPRAGDRLARAQLRRPGRRVRADRRRPPGDALPRDTARRAPDVAGDAGRRARGGRRPAQLRNVAHGQRAARDAPSARAAAARDLRAVASRPGLRPRASRRSASGSRSGGEPDPRAG